MARIKLTKKVADAAIPGARDYELRDTVVPGFLLKVTRVGRKIFVLQYRTNAGIVGSPRLDGSASSQSSKLARLLKIGLPRTVGQRS